MDEVTPNQVVAWNLNLARVLRGWTQEQAAEHLEPYLGERWSKGSFSVAERSIKGRRIKHFDADEIVAFARGFDLPVWWFFVPPESDLYGRYPKIETPEGDKPKIEAPELLGRVVDLDRLLARFDAVTESMTPEQRDQLRLRLETFSRELYVKARDWGRVREQRGDEEIVRTTARTKRRRAR